MNIVKGPSPVLHDEDAEYHESGKPCVGKITIELTEDQIRTIHGLLVLELDVSDSLEREAYIRRLIDKFSRKKLAKAKS